MEADFYTKHAAIPATPSFTAQRFNKCLAESDISRLQQPNLPHFPSHHKQAPTSR